MAENKFTLNSVANANTVGYNGKMSVFDIMSVFQFAVTLHTEQMGVGFNSVMQNHGGKWIISRVRFEIDYYPQNAEQICVETWPLKPSAVRFGRCFLLNGEKGVSARAISDWCIIDAKTNMPLRSKNIPISIDTYIEDKCVVNGYSLFNAEVCEDDLVYSKQIRISDLDLNGHVNNVTYIKTALDCFSTSELESFEIKSFEMYYHEQCFEGDTLYFYLKALSDNEFYIEAKKNGNRVFCATVNK